MAQNRKQNIIITILIAIIILMGIFCAFVLYQVNKKEKIEISTDKEIKDEEKHIAVYDMTDEDIIELPTRQIVKQDITDEQKNEQEVESEDFQEQGEIAYNGTSKWRAKCKKQSKWKYSRRTYIWK